MNSESWGFVHSRRGKSALLHSSWSKQPYLLWKRLFASCFLFLLSHRRSDILEGRSKFFFVYFEWCCQIRWGSIVFFVFFNHGLRKWFFFRFEVNSKLFDTIAHNIKKLFIFGRLFILVFDDTLEAICELDVNVRTQGLGFRGLDKFRELIGRIAVGWGICMRLRTQGSISAALLMGPIWHNLFVTNNYWYNSLVKLSG